MEAGLTFDIGKVPFSYPGAYYTIQKFGEDGGEPAGIYLRSLHQDAWQPRGIQLIAEREGREIPWVKTGARPYELCLEADGGKAVFCFAGSQNLFFRTEGIGLRLRYVRASQMTRRSENQWETNCPGQNMKAVLEMRSGRCAEEYEWDGDNAVSACHHLSEAAEGMLCLVRNQGSGMAGLQEKEGGYSEYRKAAERAFAGWNQAGRKETVSFPEAWELAVYLNWSSLVDRCGQIPIRTMYASKASMVGIWSWDHCFHALGALQADPKMAWEQWSLMFYRQAADGSLPDRMDDGNCYWSFSKPPVHGFFLSYLQNAGLRLGEKEKRFAADHLEAWTEYWLRYHDSDGDGIAEYDNGNDSGWDNNTVMAEGGPLESPDLTVWLMLQMDCLAELRAELGEGEAAQRWRERSRCTMEKFTEHFWDEDTGCMTGRLSGSHKRVYADSLLLYLPLLLGERLDRGIRDRMIAQLKQEGGFRTPYGLATERLSSKWYCPDGYWRGPIWAPSTFLICVGLKRCGEVAFAEELRQRFLKLCAESMTMAENYNAQTGEPLRDQALVWTASVFLAMASEPGE